MNNKNLNLIKKIQKDLSFKLDLIDLEIKVENIEKAGELRIKENCIAISENILSDKLLCITTIVHELRHVYQILSIYDDNEIEIYRDRWKEELSTGKAKDLFSFIELDAYSFEKYYLKEMYDIDYTFDNVKLDELTDEYIDKYLIKIDIK